MLHLKGILICTVDLHVRFGVFGPKLKFVRAKIRAKRAKIPAKNCKRAKIKKVYQMESCFGIISDWNYSSELPLRYIIAGLLLFLYVYVGVVYGSKRTYVC